MNGILAKCQVHARGLQHERSKLAYDFIQGQSLDQSSNICSVAG